MGRSCFAGRAILAGMLLAAPGANATGNAANGALVFQRCAICHTSAKSGSNGVGPNLFGIVGRKAGSIPGFFYSAAMKSAGFVWTDARLDAYIAAPQTVVPGNRMPFAGLRSAGDRADLVAYLDTLK